MAAGVIELANEVHDRLLKLVAPASPASIRASTLRPSGNSALFWICVSAAFFFVVFIIPVIVTALSKKGADQSDLSDLKDLLQIVGGAGLGSAFYALYTASSYIKTSTFDPKYNTTYSLRFFIGLLSGLILAYFLRDVLKLYASSSVPAAGAASGNNVQLANIGVAALALIGGYAAEAVARILDRVSETLVTLVSGSDKDKIDAERQKATADADKKTAQMTSDTARKLQQALTETDVKAAVQRVMGDLLK